MDKLMRKFLFFVFLFFAVFSYAQENIVEKVIRLRQLVIDTKTQEALALIKQIENECINSDNDTIKAIFLELKGQTLLDIEKYGECISVCKEAISLFERSNIRQYEYLDAWYIIATSYHRLRDYKKAESYYRKGLLRSVAANVDNVEQYRSNLYLNLGNIYEEQGDTLLANECYKKVVKSPERELIDIDNWNYIDWENSYWDKILKLTNEKRYKEASDQYIGFINGIREKKGNKFEAYLLATESRGILLSRYLNDIDKAIPLFIELINLSDSINGANESICSAYCNVILCYSRKGMYNMVDRYIPAGLSYLNICLNEYYPPHSIFRYAGNGAYWKQDYSNAIRYYEKYLSPNYKRESGTNYEEIVNQLSVSYILTGQQAKAQSFLKAFLKSDESRLKKEDSPVLANVYYNLGRSYMLNGKTKKALVYLNKSKDLQLILYGEVTKRTIQYIQECSK